MDATALIVPTIASFALGGALLLPIRDNRKGRKATISARTPLTPDVRKSVQLSLGVVEATAVADDRTQSSGARTHVRIDDPLSAIRTILDVLRAKASPLPSAVEVPSAPDASDVTIERSFAQELAALLPAADSSDLDESVGTIRATSSCEAPDEGEAEAPIRATTEDRASPWHSVAPGSSFADRIVPLTRVPLRYAPRAITWPAGATPALVLADDPARYAYLRSAAHARSIENDPLMARAYREETPIGRALALTALSRTPTSRTSIDTFVTALASGTVEERAMAVDALAEAGAREELSAGLSDRVDAIAARAALAYVGTTVRADFRSALEPFADEARIEAILEILAGLLE